MKPSDFKKHPYDSIFQNTETEIVARNIMVMLARTGDTWRELSWQEYTAERAKDGGGVYGQKAYFDKVIKYCASAETARLFSPAWEKV